MYRTFAIADSKIEGRPIVLAHLLEEQARQEVLKRNREAHRIRRFVMVPEGYQDRPCC